MKITFNAPFTIYFAISAFLIFLISGGNNDINDPFVLQGTMQPTHWKWYVGLIGYPLAHANFQHLLGNFSIILLLGPILENNYICISDLGFPKSGTGATSLSPRNREGSRSRERRSW